MTSACPEFTGAADFGSRLVAALAEDGLLEPDLFLNVDHPNPADGDTTAADNQISVVPLTGDGTAPRPNGRVGVIVRKLG